MNQRKKELIAKILLAAMIVPRTSQAALAAAQISEGTGRTAEILLETDSNAEAVWETDSKKILFTEKDEDEEPKKLPRYYQTADEDGIYFFEDRYGKMQYRIFGSIMGNGQKPESASDAYVEAGVPTGWYDRDTKKAVDLEEEYYMLAPYVWEAVPEEEVTGEHFKELFRKQPNLETTYETENYFYMGLYGENWDASRYGVWDFTDWDTAETEDDIQYWFYGHAVNTGQETADAWFAVSDGAAVYSSDVYTQAYAVGTDYGNDKTSGGSSGGVWVTNDRVYENIRASASADPEHNRIIVNVYKINKKASGSKEATYGVVGEVHLLLGGCHDVFLKKNKPRAGSYYPVSTNQQGRDVGDINRIGYSFSSTVGQKVKPKADYYRSTDNVKLNSEYVNLKKYAKDALDAPYIETQYYGLGTEDMNLDVKGGIFSVCIYNPPEDLTDIAFMMSQYNYYDHQEDGDSSHYESAFIHISDVNGVRLDSVMEELNKAKEVTLSFNGNGGTEKAVSIPAEPGKAIGTLPKASRTGYTFAGWYTAADGGSRITEQTAAPDTAMTYYAHWTVNRYTATFHSAGSHDGAVITKNYQDTLGTLPMTERTGYRFKGWFTAASGGNPVSPATKVGASDADYYAQWEANRWTVIYDANGGSGGMGVSTFSYGAENRLSGNTFTKTGYHFAGWAREPKGKTTFQDSAKAGNMTAVPEDTIYLYAVWEANPYSVTLHRNLGKEDTVSVTQQYQYDREYRLLERVFEKAGYTFAGWTAGRDGSGEFHEEGAKVHNWAEDGEIALYAQWTPNRYRLYYGANGGQVESPSKEVVYDAAVGELPVPKRTNYRFIGWTLHGKPAEAASLYRTEGDSYAYAQWELNFRLQEDTNTNIRPGKDDTFGTADDEIYTNGPDGIPNTEDDREVFPGKDGIYGTEDDYYILNPPHGDRIYAGADRKFNTPDDYMERGNGLILHPGGDCYFGEEPGAPLSAAEDNEIWWKGEDEKTGTKDTAADDRLVHAGKDEAYGTGDDYMDEETGKNRRPGRDGVFGTEDDSISFNGRDTLPGTADDYLHFAKPGLNHRPGADCVFDTEADELTDAGDDAWYWDGADGLPGTEDDTCVYPGEDGTYGTSDDFYQYTQTPYKGNRIYAGKDGIFGTSDDYMEYGQDGKLLYPGLDRLFGTGDDRVDTGKGTNTDLSGNAEQTNGADGIPGTADDKPIDTDTAGNRYVDNGDKTSLWPGLDGIFGTEDDRIDTGKGTNTDVSGNAEQTNGADGIPGTDDDKPVLMDTAGNPYVDNEDKTVCRPGPDGIWGTQDDENGPLNPAAGKPDSSEDPPKPETPEKPERPETPGNATEPNPPREPEAPEEPAPLVKKDEAGNAYIDKGDKTIIRPGKDQMWNTKDDEKWYIGDDGKPGTADDRLIKTDSDGKEYADNGDKTILRPGRDGQFGTKDDETWNIGPDQKPGTADDYRIGRKNFIDGSGGGSPSAQRIVHAELPKGKWILDSTGWWYSFDNGTWPKAQWAYLKWQEHTDWYYFDADGYMKTGWYSDTDGSWYYLHPTADGTRGHMYIGWHLLDGKYYCFAESGRLYVSCVTPDGYTVNAAGVRDASPAN